VTSLAVLASRVRFEEKCIFAALERRGLAYTHLDTRRFFAVAAAGPGTTAAGTTGAADTTTAAGTTGASTAGGADAAPRLAFDAVLSREISQSRGFYACLLLEAQGIPTVSRSAVIAACGDKAQTSVLLQAAGLPTPRTVVALTPEAGLEAAETLGFPVVIKPLTGSWGRLVTVLRDRREAQAVLEHRAALAGPQQHVVYLQELVDKPGRDIRVLVAGDEVVAASYRYGVEWRTGVARSGRSEPCPLTDDITGLARRAARAVGGGFLGVDLVEGPGGLAVIEVNHTPEFRGLAQAHGDAVDVPGAIVRYLLASTRRAGA
jgi:[lysine-biosynthesis-protein LysW]---L-2-aminoadipate ligase